MSQTLCRMLNLSLKLVSAAVVKKNKSFIFKGSGYDYLLNLCL